MEYEEVIELLNGALEDQEISLDPSQYQAVLIKNIPSTDVHPDLSEGRGHQYHIALSGEQTEAFPYLTNYLYQVDGDSKFKRHYLLKIPVKLEEKNVEYLRDNQPDDYDKPGPNEFETHTTCVRAERSGGNSQLELFDKRNDGSDFEKFRLLLHENDFLIFLQHRNEFLYTALGVKASDAEDVGLNETKGYYISDSNEPQYSSDGRVLVEPELFEDAKRKIKNIITEEMNYADKLETTGDLYFPEDMKKRIHRSILSSLISGKNIILVGPPGTGKTTIAENIASSIMDDDFIFSTATSDWTTFNTTGGYYPKKSGRDLEFKPGIFLSCFREDGLPANKWLVVDEINRADIDKAFGELFTVMAGKDVDLPYTGENDENISIKYMDEPDNLDNETLDLKNDYYVTPRWRIIATLNTWDKASLYEMSYAFMRRFTFIDVDIPDIEDGIVEKYIENSSWGIKKSDVEDFTEKVEEIWKTMNETGREIGPAIIKDILLFLKNYRGEKEYVQAIAQYIFPQMEGMVPDRQNRLLLKLWNKMDNDEFFKKIAMQRFDEVELSGQTET